MVDVSSAFHSVSVLLGRDPQVHYPEEPGRVGREGNLLLTSQCVSPRFDTANQRFMELAAAQNFLTILLAIQISGS